MKFKVGDRVKIIRDVSGNYTQFVGVVTTIEAVTSTGYSLKDVLGGENWVDKELELIKENSNMSKFYRVKKDTPAWEAGAILKHDSDKSYSPISDLWNTEAADEAIKDTPLCMRAALIENCPEWFERVYEVSVLGKSKYLIKEGAKKAHEELMKK